MPSSSASPAPSAPAASLDLLDERLVGVRRMLQRPGYRRRLLSGLSHNLELGTLRLVRAVQRASSPPSIGAVAEALAIDPSTASRMVDSAAAAGFIERRACEEDRRRAQLHLTAEGEATLNEVTARRRALLTEVTASWSADDLSTLVTLLARLTDDFDQFEESI